jgi:hypothetical protein
LENIENGKPNAFEEFINAYQNIDRFEDVFENLNKENQTKFTKFFVPKLNAHVQALITNHDKMDKDKFIEEVKKIVPFKSYLTEEIDRQITNLLKTYLETDANQNIKNTFT